MINWFYTTKQRHPQDDSEDLTIAALWILAGFIVAVMIVL